MVWHDASGSVLLMQNGAEGQRDVAAWKAGGTVEFQRCDRGVDARADDGRPRGRALRAGWPTTGTTTSFIVFGGGLDGTGERGRETPQSVSAGAPGPRASPCRALRLSRRPRWERITVTTLENGAIIEWPGDPRAKYDGLPRRGDGPARRV